MKNFIRPLIVVGILGVIFAPQLMPFVSAVFYPVSEWKKDAEKIHNEQVEKNCNQFINAKYCTAPRERADRWLCSQRLAESHCAEYVDVGYLVLDEHREKYKDTKNGLYWQTMKGK